MKRSCKKTTSSRTKRVRRVEHEQSLKSATEEDSDSRSSADDNDDNNTEDESPANDVDDDEAVSVAEHTDSETNTAVMVGGGLQVINPALQAVVDEVLDTIGEITHSRWNRVINKDKNIFITGPAGSGKSWLIKRIVQELRNNELQVKVAAPTGTAALNVGGLTCHTLLNLTPNAQHRRLTSVAAAGNEPRTRQRLSSLDVLVLDEISMISSEFLKQMDAIFQEARRNDAPFGGVIVIAVGDFAQLPPVKPHEYCADCGNMRGKGLGGKWFCSTCEVEVQDDDKWAFKARVWGRLEFNNILLDQILRQNEGPFKKIVFDLFLGNQLKIEQNRMLAGQTNAIGKPVKLFTTRQLTQRENDRKYKQLTTAEVKFSCVDDCFISTNHKESITFRNANIKRIFDRDPGTNHLTFFKDHKYAPRLKLRIDMPVVLLANLDVKGGLVNGSQGTLVGWHHEDITGLPVISDAGTTSGYLMDGIHGRVMTGYVPALAE